MRFSSVLMGIPLGMLVGMALMTPSIQKTLLKSIRQKIFKFKETHTLAITDFADLQVSLDSFCEQVLGPEVFYKKNNELRKMYLAILLLFIATVAVLAVEIFVLGE